MRATCQVRRLGVSKYFPLAEQLRNEFLAKNRDCRHWRDELGGAAQEALIEALRQFNAGSVKGEPEPYIATAIRNALQTSADERHLVGPSGRQIQVEREEHTAAEREQAKKNKCPECGRDNPQANGYPIDPTTGALTAEYVDKATGQKRRLCWCAGCYERIAARYPRALKPAYARKTKEVTTEHPSREVTQGDDIKETWATVQGICQDDLERGVVRFRAAGLVDDAVAERLEVAQSTVTAARHRIKARFDSPPLDRPTPATYRILSDRSRPKFRPDSDLAITA